MSLAEQAKKRAAEAAVSCIESGNIIGLGSGSTAKHFIEQLGKRLSSGVLTDILAVPSSYQASKEAYLVGIPLTTLTEHPCLDISVDGADQLNTRLEIIKGGGGALLKEKVIASASEDYIIIVDDSKLTDKLGDNCRVPLEVLPFSLGTVVHKMEALGASVIIRTFQGKLGPVITDNGNFILDCDFGFIEDPKNLHHKLCNIPGVLETGLFIGYAKKAFIGTNNGVIEIKAEVNE